MGWEDGTPVAPPTPAGAPALEPWQMGTPVQDLPRAASGPLEAIQAGWQGSVPGLAWRGRLPDLISDPAHSKWWERALTGLTQVGAELPIMIPAGAAGAAGGSAVAGPIGGILAGGAATFAAPAAIRETLMQAYKAGDIKTGADFWNALREVAAATAKEGLIGAATMGTGALAKGAAAAALGAGEAAVPIGLGRATLLTQGAQRAAGAADVAGQIAAMTALPAALQGRLPDAQEVIDAAVVIGGLKAGHMLAGKIADVYAKTGRTPAEQAADAHADPTIAEDLVRQANAERTGTASGIPVKLDRLIAEAEYLGRGPLPEANTRAIVRGAAEAGRLAPQQNATAIDQVLARAEMDWQIPWAPDVKALIRDIKRAGPLQGDLLTDVGRLERMADAVGGKAETVINPETHRAEIVTTAPRALTEPERAELADLRTRIAAGLHEQQVSRETGLARIYEDVREKMRAAGRSPEEATAIALLERERYRARGERAGEDPAEMYFRRPLAIRGEPGEAGIEAGTTPSGPPGPEWVKLKPGAGIPGIKPPDVYERSDDIGTRRMAMRNGRVVSDLSQGDYEGKDHTGEPVTITVVKDHLSGSTEARIGLSHKIDITPMLEAGLTIPEALRRTLLGADTALPTKKVNENRAVAGPLRGVADPEIRDEIKAMAYEEAGWLTEGGKLDLARYVAEGGTLDAYGRPEKLGVVAFTKWIPKAEWWPDRPDKKMNAAAYKAAVDKLLAGEKLTPAEQRAIDYLVEVANKRLAVVEELGPEEYNAATRDVLAADLEATTDNIIDADAVARVAAFDEALVERLAIEHGADDVSFMRAIREILQDKAEAERTRGEAAAGGETDTGQAPGEGGNPPLRYHQTATERTPIWYSELARQLGAAKMEQAPAKGWKDYIRGLAQKGVKADEVKWSGIEDWLDAQGGKVTKAQVLAFLEQGGVKVREVLLGGLEERTPKDPVVAGAVERLERAGYTVDQDPGNASRWGVVAPDDIGEIFVDVGDARSAFGEQQANGRWVIPEEYRDLVSDIDHVLDYMNSAPVATQTKFGNYRLPGGENYRELLLTVPSNKTLSLPTGWHIEKMRPDDAALERMIVEWREFREQHHIPDVSADEIPSATWDRLSEDVQRQVYDFMERWDDAQQLGRTDRYTLVDPTGVGTMMPSSRTLEDATRNAIEYLQRTEKLPRIQEFDSSHFDEPNIATHVRFTDRSVEEPGFAVVNTTSGNSSPWMATKAEAEAYWEKLPESVKAQTVIAPTTHAAKVLFVEEIQSDWAQQGKKQGFADANAEAVKAAEADFETAHRIALEEYDAAAPIMRAHLSPEALRLDNPVDRAMSAIDDERAMTGSDETWRHLYRVTDDAEARAITDYLDAMHQADQMERALEAARQKNKGRIPRGPFVEKTDAWTALALKRMIRWAAENGYDKIAWTTGEQQVERYTSALRHAVDVIDWKKTPEGIQLIGYKGPRQVPGDIRDDAAGAVSRNDNLGFDTPWDALSAVLEHADWRDRWPDIETEADLRAIDNYRTAWLSSKARGRKIVDTTEKETALSDAIGKAMADQIINDPHQEGVIEGEGIRIDDTGMAGFYDKIVPKVANEVLKKLGGGKVGSVGMETGTKAKPPEFRPFSESDFDGYGGAENFGDESSPLLAKVRLMIDGAPETTDIIVDYEGVHVIASKTDFPDNEAFAAWTQFVSTRADLSRAQQSQDGARAVLAYYWGKNSLWDSATNHMRDEHQVRPIGDATEQHAFDITPALRERAMQGLPLFQEGKSRQEAAPGTDTLRGAYTPGENLVELFRGADKSTALHELGHSWLEELKADAALPNASEQLKADWETARRELAIPASGDISVASHEQWARSVERYVSEGKAPSVELAGLFARFREWLMDLWRQIRERPVDVSPDLRAVLDRLLATDEQLATARDLGVPRAYVEPAKVETARKIIPGTVAEQAAQKPLADELPPGPGEAPDKIHVNYKYINTPTDLKLAMQRLAELDQAEISRQRGGVEGVKSWAMANAEQQKYLNDVLGGSEDTLHLFAARDPNAPQIDVRLGVMKKLVVGAAREAERLRDLVLEHAFDATIQEQLEYMGALERLRMLQAEFLGERASVARALNALKDTTEGSGEISRMLEVIGVGDARLFQRSPAEQNAFLKAKLDEILLNYKGKSVLDIARLHKEIGSLKGTYKLAKAASEATTWDKIIEAWKSGLLSGPVTHVTNLFGTGAFQALRPVVDTVAAGIGIARGAKPGERLMATEGIARLTGWLGGVQDAAKLAWHTFQLQETTGKTESYRNAIEGRKGDIIRIPLRAMAAEDALVNAMYTRGELRTLAMREAFRQGLDPRTREFAEAVDRLVDNPTAEMKVTAEAAAERMTFNADLGEKGRILQLFVNKWHLQWMVPFIRTPINIAKEMGRLSPFAPLVGEWRAAIAKGGIGRDRALAELAIGSGLMTLAASWAFSGNLSGSGSPDQGKNRAKVGVWQPYSALVGDTWFEYARIQPVGTLIGLAADMANVWDHMTEEEMDKVPKMLAIAFANAVTNQTFLQGITNFVNAMSDPTRFAPQFGRQLAASMVPNIVGQPTAMADPVVREVNSMLEAIQARIPGARQQLLPKRDWLGEPVETKERLGVVSPIRQTTVSEDKVRQEAARLDISVAAAPKKTHLGKGTGKLGEVDLTPEETDRFEQAGGQMAHQILSNIVHSAGYDQLPDLVKQNIFRNVLTASHRFAAAMALPVDKKLAYLQQITERMQAELRPEP